jgi:D-xylose transport system permease protein
MSRVDEPVRGVESKGDGREPSAPVGEVERMADPGAAEVDVALAPELVANTLGEYFRGWWVRVRGGETGVLPVIVGLLIIGVIFQVQNSNFLTAGNLVNLMVQGSTFMLLGMAEVFALLLGEIDLSIGFNAGIGGVVAAELVKAQTGWPWWAAVIVAVLVTAAIGGVEGTIITRLGLPSFVVTLAGLLGLQGVMLIILGQGGTLPINDTVMGDLANGNLTVAAGWIILVVLVGGYALLTWTRDARRRRSGLVAVPVSLTLLKIALVAVFGVVVVLISNTNRGALEPIRGLPWVVLIVLGVLGMWSFLLGRTKFGRYMYAVGGNPEAARRAGVNLSLIRTTAFALAGFTAGIAGIIYASRLRSVSTTLDGGQLVLFAVASAVIGGTSLFGGRGKALHAVLGGIVIASIYNGMGLLGLSAASQYIVTALVLLAAVTVDALARRGRTAR